MGRHYIPRSDVDFLVWTGQFMGRAGRSGPRLGLSSKSAVQLTEAWNAFRAAYTAHLDTHKAAAAAFRTKTQSRRHFEALLRAAVRQIQSQPGLTDRDRKELGIAVPKRTRTRRRPRQSRPVLRIDASKHRLHIVRFADESTPSSRGKPRGVQACEVWRAVTPGGQAAPSIPLAPGARSSAYECVAVATRSPAPVTFTGAQAGRTAHYIARWQQAGGGVERWSDIVSASITG